ncbi:hypothetical protein [Salirhabdus salicampi]|nr:hypothetical protein [Salirhabdus salicampi]MCP8616198.1 hypothetical protein [Salirhabdus salicampi]
MFDYKMDIPLHEVPKGSVELNSRQSNENSESVSFDYNQHIPLDEVK